MKSLSRLLSRSSVLTAAIVLGGVLAAPALITHHVYAGGQLSPRKLTLSSSAPGNISTDANGTAVAPGAGGNGAKAKHTFNFTFGTANPVVNSIAIQYCTTPLFNTACGVPTGMDAATVATIVTQTGFSGSAYTLDTTTVANTGGVFGTAPCPGSTPYRQNCILLKRTGATADTTANPAYTLAFGQGAGTDWIKNPTAIGTFYIRISAFSDNAYTTTVDEGGIAASTTTSIDITAKVQEKLNFSVAAASASPTGCPALSGTNAVVLGDSNGVLDIATAYDAHSYFRVSTNASSGTNIYYSGDTLKTTGGTNVISAVATSQTASATGTAQFGLGIDSNDTQSGNGYSFTSLVAQAPYQTGQGTLTNGTGTARFAFDTASVTTPVLLASAPSNISCDTGSVRYLGNIATTTKAGVYRTTINYIAVPTF